MASAYTTEQRIFDTASRDGMPRLLAAFLVDQSKHETGNYSSRFFTVGNNGFGYSYSSGSKWQLDRGGPNADNGVPIAQYKSIEDSVHEMTDWIRRRQKEGKFPADLRDITEPEQYAHLLKVAGYYQASESTYAGALASYFYSAAQNFTMRVKKNPALFIGGALLITGAIVFFLNRKKVFN